MSEQLHEQQQAPEREPALQPRIYVASLSDYNAGRLHGVWLDADQTADELQDAVDVMLKQSSELWAEEYAVHDYEGFGPVRVEEFTSLDVVAVIAGGLAEHGVPFGHWTALIGPDIGELDRFEETYRGQWPSLAAWAEDAVDDLGVFERIDHLPDWIQPYVSIDYGSLGRDMATDCLVAEDAEGVYVFDGS